MTTAIAFDLRAAIRVVLDSTDLSDPSDVAQCLLAGMDTATRALAFEQVAEMVVSHHMTLDRHRRQPAEGKVDTEPSAHPGPPHIATVVQPQAARSVSSRADRIRQWWRAELRKRYRGAEEWLLLGEFSPVDHEYAAHERRDRAAAITAYADWHEMCAKAMRDHGADRFGDLPDAVLEDLLAKRRPE